LQALTSETQDIFALLVCAFWVYYNPHSDGFPSHRNEELGHWVGVDTHVGDTLTYKILYPQQKVIYCLIIRSALDPTLHHKRLDPLGGAVSHTDEPSVPLHIPTIDPKDLVGITFLKDSEAYGQRFRARLVRAILDLCEVNNDTADEIYTYNHVLNFIEQENLDMDSDTEQLYRFRRINGHRAPRSTSHVRCQLQGIKI
jgi:hypothetical protein